MLILHRSSNIQERHFSMEGDHDQKSTEVRETNKVKGDTNVTRQTVETSHVVDSRVIMQRIIYYVTGFIVAVLLFRIALLLLAANQGSGFVDFVYNLSYVFAWPFFGMFSYEPAYGRSIFEISSVVAVVVYSLIGAGIARLFAITGEDDEAV